MNGEQNESHWNHTDALSMLSSMDLNALPSTLTIGSDHKAVIVIDHSPGFAVSTNNKMTVLTRDQITGQLRNSATFVKTLWSSAVEATVEFHRIVEEVFPDGTRLLRIVISDFVGRFLTVGWGTKLISVFELLNSLATCGVPDAKADMSSCSIISGISMAIDSISELTELQKKYVSIYNSGQKRVQKPSAHTNIADKREANRPSAVRFSNLRKKILYAQRTLSEPSESNTKKAITNKGSIIVLTSLKTDEEILMIEKHITEDVINRNKIVKALDGDKNFAPITHVNVYIICVIPVCDNNDKQPMKPTVKPLTKINEYVSCRVICSEANPSFRAALHSVIMEQYNLDSTTVTSIPMKEEAQQGQSSNYDVEILHPRRAHIILKEYGLIEPQSKLRQYVQLGGYDTVNLAWSTAIQKNRCNQYPLIISTLPISPANFCSRPSVCLTSFVIGGKNVLLEVPKGSINPQCGLTSNINDKLISHILACHSGRIYLHTLWISSHPILDAERFRSVSKMPRVQSLRTTDFANVMKECRITASIKDRSLGDQSSANLFNEKGRRILKRITRFWPSKLSDAFIYNIPQKFEPLLSLVKKSELSTSDVNKCKESINAFTAYKDSRDVLTSKTLSCSKFGTLPNREEQFQVACDEIAHHLWNYVNHSERHLEVFNMFLQISGLDRTLHLAVTDVLLKEEKTESSSTATKRVAEVEGTAKSKTLDTPAHKRSRKSPPLWASDELISLADLMNQLYEKEYMSNYMEFVGREKAGNKPANLYPHLDLGKKSPSKSDDA